MPHGIREFQNLNKTTILRLWNIMDFMEIFLGPVELQENHGIARKFMGAYGIMWDSIKLQWSSEAKEFQRGQGIPGNPMLK